MLQSVLLPIVIVATMAFAVVAIVKILSDGRTRRRLIDTGASADVVAAITAAPLRDPALYESLRWALVIGAIGLALVLIEFLPYRADEPIVYGLVLLFAAAGLFVYYATARRLARS